ncbi:MAG: DUF1385 domain-containing protein [Acutalibacteraceae bacterium]|jgi:uncharacterized protein YqhQ|nr:DUF1385 domain-containing protein [Acutalibacteraceae bacterium]
MAKYTSIGGQALIEGILMKSPEKTALAVRMPNGEIDLSYINGKSLREKYKILNLPVIRGVIAFAESMINGYKAMMLSAEKSGFTDLEEEKPKDEKKQNALVNTVMVIGSVLGVLLAVVLFMYLPRLFVSGIEYLFSEKITSKLLRSAIEQFLKLTIFVIYVFAVSFMKDIKRVFMYHGAEHKTIFAYEKGLELTVENVRTQKRFHPRCGTSFMILMILVSIIISTAVQMIFPTVYNVRWLWVIAKILIIPITCGIGFEILKICGKYDNVLTRIISAPGMWLQRITTKEPEDGMIEIAIAALNACKPEVPDVERN